MFAFSVLLSQKCIVFFIRSFFSVPIYSPCCLKGTIWKPCFRWICTSRETPASKNKLEACALRVWKEEQGSKVQFSPTGENGTVRACSDVEKVGHFDTILHLGCTGRKVGCTSCFVGCIWHDENNIILSNFPHELRRMPEDACTNQAIHLEQGTGVEPFLVQIHPPLPFSDYFAQIIWSKRCAEFLAWKRKTPAPVWLWSPFRSRFSLALQYFGLFQP